eukprot:scaffold408_cov71-Cylindrotheca_fusiformis.AAC.2
MQHHNEEAEDEAWMYNGKDDVPPTVRRVKIAETVARIPDEAFRFQDIEEVILSSSVQVIGREAFRWCFKLKSILYQGQEKEDVGIPSTVKVIGDEAFYGCPILQELVLNEGLKRIGKGAFAECYFLTEVEIPSTVKMIVDWAFCGCRSLARLALNQGLERIGAFAFNLCQSLTEVNVPCTVKVIDNSAFLGCKLLGRLGLNEGLKRIGVCAFVGCGSLTEVDVPSTVKMIDNGAFQDCRRLARLGLNEGLERIGAYAFIQCDSLSHVRIPKSVYTLATSAFIHCMNLISIEFPEECLFNIDLSGCESLVSLAGPKSIFFFQEDEDREKFFQRSKLGSLVDNVADLIRRLNHRFDNSPLNKLCYYQSYQSLDDAMAQLHSLVGDAPLAATTQVDEFDMTPLHVLSLSLTPNLDMLLAVMDAGKPGHMVCVMDSFGCTPMDYLSLNRIPNSDGVIRRLFQTRFGQTLDLDKFWKSDMLQAINTALSLDWSSRKSEIGRVVRKYQLKEILSLVELRLWKIKIDEASTNAQTADREFCRISSGAAAVIPHLLPFLGNEKDYFVASQ